MNHVLMKDVMYPVVKSLHQGHDDIDINPIGMSRDDDDRLCDEVTMATDTGRRTSRSGGGAGHVR